MHQSIAIEKQEPFFDHFRRLPKSCAIII